MSRRNAYSNQIIALALFHRYGWLIVMLTFMQFFPSLYIVSAFFLAFAVWSFGLLQAINESGSTSIVPIKTPTISQ